MTSVMVDEIGTVSGVKPRTVRKWVESGEPAGVRLDRDRAMVRSHDLEPMLLAIAKARASDARDDPQHDPAASPRGLIVRAFLHDDGQWRWTVLVLWPLLYIAAIVGSVGLGGILH